MKLQKKALYQKTKRRRTAETSLRYYLPGKFSKFYEKLSLPARKNFASQNYLIVKSFISLLP